MPPEIVLVLLASMAIAAIAPRVSRARRRRDPGRRDLPGERQLAWLGDRIDESIAMWILRGLLRRTDDDEHEMRSADVPSARLPVHRSATPAVGLGPNPPDGQMEWRRRLMNVALIDESRRRDRLPRAHPHVDPRGRLRRDAAVVLLGFVVVGAIIVSIQPAGLFGGVAALTGSPEGSQPFMAIGGSIEGTGSPAPTPSPARSPTARADHTTVPTPSPRPTQEPIATERPTPRPTPKPTPRPSPVPTPKPTARPTPTPAPTPAPPTAQITVSPPTACTADAPASYSFTAAASIGAVSYAWTFSGGIPGATTETVTRDFPGSTAGTDYTIALTVQNSVGSSDSTSTQITVVCP